MRWHHRLSKILVALTVTAAGVCSPLSQVKASEVSAGSTADRQWAQTGRSQEGNTELELGNLSLTQVPSGIGQLTNLRSLSLTCNQLSGLPAEIGQLNNLQVLDLDNNQLCSLPLEISQLSNLIKPVEG